MALSTMNSSAKRMWQKFFLLFRMAVISPHCSKTSWMISSVAFSGNPPTNTVLHPGGRSLVEGGGRSNDHNRNRGVCCLFIFCAIPGSPGERGTCRVTFSSLSRDKRLHGLTLMAGCPIFTSSPLLLPTFTFCGPFYKGWLSLSMNRDKANVTII